MDDSARLLALYKQHAAINASGNLGVNEEHWKQIAAQFPGRTVVACKEQFRRLNNIAAGKPPRERPRKANPKFLVRSSSDPLRQPPSLPDPVSLTAMIFGDPLPGRSALDRKLSREARV